MVSISFLQASSDFYWLIWDAISRNLVSLPTATVPDLQIPGIVCGKGVGLKVRFKLVGAEMSAMFGLAIFGLAMFRLGGRTMIYAVVVVAVSLAAVFGAVGLLHETLQESKSAEQA